MTRSIIKTLHTRSGDYYELLVNKENPINIEYLNDIVIPNLEKVDFFRDNYLDIIKNEYNNDKSKFDELER